MVAFLRLWDRIVYGRDHRAKWAALAAIRAQESASWPWNSNPPRYTQAQIEKEAEWMLCAHTDGFVPDDFIVRTEECRVCGMPRYNGPEEEGIYTFVRLDNVRELWNDDHDVRTTKYDFITISVPVRAEGRQRVRGPAVVQ